MISYWIPLSFIYSTDDKVKWQALFEIYLSKLEPGQKDSLKVTSGEDINDIYRKNKETENMKCKGQKARKTRGQKKKLRRKEAWEMKIDTEFL